MKPYYEQSGITIYHGDCREVVANIPCVDLVVTSPPYGNQRDYEGTADDWNDIVPPALAGVPSHENTQIVVNLGLIHRDGEVVEYWNALTSTMRFAGWRLFGWYVWDQGSGLPGDWCGRFAPSHEFVFHFNKKSCQLEKPVPCVSYGRRITGTGLRGSDGTTSDRMTGDGDPVNKTKIPDSVIRVTREMRRCVDHPAVYPVRFAAELITAFPGGIVLDPFMGSGTTLRAAKDLGRRAIGIEVVERYCEIAARRLEQGVLNFAG